MQVYGESFAAAYNTHWARFSRNIAPRVIEWLRGAGISPDGGGHRGVSQGGGSQRGDAGAVSSGAAAASGRDHEMADAPPRVVDLCCAAGHFTAALCDAGYAVYGIDLSEPMIGWARRNCAPHLDSKQLELSVQDATSYSIPEPADAVVSLFDSLNHLLDLSALRDCLAASARAVRPGGVIGFDLNTENGLKMRWRNVSVEEQEEVVLISRGMYLEEERRGYISLSGFSRREDGLYERFGQTVFNTAFTMREVEEALAQTGWRDIEFRRFPDLAEQSAEPEAESRVFVSAVRAE